jgi:hypothetical protein
MVDSDIARRGRDNRRNTKNINLSDNDLARLLTAGQPGNVTGGRAGNPGILGLLNQQKSNSTFQMTPRFNPRMTTADLINQNTDSPDVVQPRVPSNPITNPIEEIMGQLQKLMSGGGQNLQFQPMQLPTFDPNRFKNQAETAVNSQYDPIIQQIIAQQGQTQQRARQNRVAVRDLYAGATQDINAGAAQTSKQYDQAQAQSQQMYTDERNKIAAGYAADAAAQRAEAKRLGTEALGVNEAIAAQNADKQFTDSIESQQMQAQNAAFEMQQQGQAAYDKSIGQATRQEGIDAQSNVMQQLADYMSQSNSDLTNTRSQEAGATNDLMYKLAQAAYDRDSQNAQFQYQQQRDYIGDNQNLQKMQQDFLLAQLQAAQQAQASSSQNGEKLNPWQQTALFADQLEPGQGSDVVGAIQAAMSERPEIYARSKDDPVAMNPALFAKLVADYQGNQGMDRNTLMQAAQQLYYLLYGQG